MTPRRRRWFSFSLRTLFVAVTLMCGVFWVVHSVNWVRQRERFFDRGKAIEVDDVHPYRPRPRAPWVLELLGEKGRRIIWVNDRAIVDETRRLFPEAEVRYHEFKY